MAEREIVNERWEITWQNKQEKGRKCDRKRNSER